MKQTNRVWCFTINNPDVIENTDSHGIVSIRGPDHDKIMSWQIEAATRQGGCTCQYEMGESGTKHIQGVIHFKKPMRLSAVKKLDGRAHWEPCKSEEASVKYCTKAESRICNVINMFPQTKKAGRKKKEEAFNDKNFGEEFGEVWTWKPMDGLEGKEPYPFQKFLIDLIPGEPDDRKIIWIFDSKGKKGKSTVVEHLVKKYKECILEVNGQASDIYHMVAKNVTDSKGNVYTMKLRAVFFDLARATEKTMMEDRGDGISYAALEKIKSGMITSGKYDSTTVQIRKPHVVVLSNWPPDRSRLSEDRWEVYEIQDNLTLKEFIGEQPKRQSTIGQLKLSRPPIRDGYTYTRRE